MFKALESESFNRFLETDFDLGWMDFNARSYDPQLGRFLQVDPMAFLAQDWTPYRFAFNNPISINDPSGLFEQQLQGQDGNWWTVNCENGECGNARRTDCPEGNCEDDKKEEPKTKPQEPIIKGPFRDAVNLPGVPGTKNN